jgi:hypothetical protein
MFSRIHLDNMVRCVRTLAPMGGVRWGHAAATACAAGVLLATGCTAGPSPDGTAVADSSPLAEILGWGMAPDATGGEVPEVTEVERQRHLQVENLIADCMADRGFTYVPVPIEQRRAGPFDEAYALDPADFAARYGYGATTLTAAEEDVVPDPNQEIADGLPPAEQEDYHRALWGEGGSLEPDAGSDDTGSDDAGSDAGPADGEGCQVWAARVAFDQDGADRRAREMERFADLFDALDDLWRRIESDPRLADTDRHWVECMSAAGYPGFTRPHDARQAVFDQLAELSAQADPDPEQVAALREVELALAPVDHRCREEYVDGPYRRVAYAHEARFVDEHRTELEAYRDWMAGEARDG